VRIVALITARSGSKRLPGKNTRLLGGKPLILWSIEVARGIDEICDILISTDSTDIGTVASEAGALVPWLRPESLATDEAGSVDVCLHAIDWYEREHGAIDGVLLLQPTSPFRGRETLLRGIELFGSGGRRAVVGVSAAQSHPLWCFRLQGDRMVPFVDGAALQSRSQELPAAYAVNGAFYLVTPAHLREHRSFYGPDMAPLIMDDPRAALDIDTEWDWRMAEAMLTAGETAPR
jgi:CMP-N,N'-diacetyllegionaminic acid synthase